MKEKKKKILITRKTVTVQKPITTENLLMDVKLLHNSTRYTLTTMNR